MRRVAASFTRWGGGIAAILACAMSSLAHGQVETTMDVGITVSTPPISLELVRSLDLGVVAVVDEDRDYILLNLFEEDEGLVIRTDNLNVLTEGHAASVIVRGDPNARYVMIVQGEDSNSLGYARLDLSNGSSVIDLILLWGGYRGRINSSGVLEITFGVELQEFSIPPQGLYTGSFNVVFAYE